MAGEIEGVAQRSSSMTINAMESEIEGMMDAIAAFVTRDDFSVAHPDLADGDVRIHYDGSVFNPDDWGEGMAPAPSMALTAREGSGVWDGTDGNAYAYNADSGKFTNISCTLNGRPIDASLVEESGTGLFIARETANIENNTQLIAKTEQQQLSLRKIVERAMAG